MPINHLKRCNVENILVGPDGGILLFDFNHATTGPTSASGLARCDLRYISPEATGRTQHDVDNRSGKHALALFAFEVSMLI